VSPGSSTCQSDVRGLDMYTSLSTSFLSAARGRDALHRERRRTNGERHKAGGSVLIPPMNILDLAFETECSFVIVFCDKPNDAEDYMHEKSACL
jgi:hypothetical protein